MKRRYLEGYFFEEFLGLRLPQLVASASAFNAMGALAFAKAFGCQLSTSPAASTQPVIDLGSLTSGLAAASARDGGEVSGSEFSLTQYEYGFDAASFV